MPASLDVSQTTILYVAAGIVGAGLVIYAAARLAGVADAGIVESAFAAVFIVVGTGVLETMVPRIHPLLEMGIGFTLILAVVTFVFSVDLGRATVISLLVWFAAAASAMAVGEAVYGLEFLAG